MQRLREAQVHESSVHDLPNVSATAPEDKGAMHEAAGVATPETIAGHERGFGGMVVRSLPTPFLSELAAVPERKRTSEESISN